MSNHTADLVGRLFYASIGEPWDFESDAGQNRLEGKIRQIVFDRSGSPLLLCEVIPFLSSGKRISSVVAVNRYTGNQNLIDALSMSGSAILNFMFQRSGEVFSAEDIEAVLRRTLSCGFLVGTMKLK
jgi:hypothetical protein